MQPRRDLTIVQNTFLFTSESVGEGHPDKIWYVAAPPLPLRCAFLAVSGGYLPSGAP
jgi:hypothetical protein